MSSWRFVCVVGAAAACALGGAACSSSNGGPVAVAFASADCRGGLVEIARFSQTATATASIIFGLASINNLAIDGDTLYMTYAFASSGSGLPTGGGIVAVPASGGSPRVVGAAQNTSQWGVGGFWIRDGQIYLQMGTDVASVPADAATPSPLSAVISVGDVDAEADAHDADFAYTAQIKATGGLTVTKTPHTGGAPTVLLAEPADENIHYLGGMVDAGDALLLHLGSGDFGAAGSVWRIAKDGSGQSSARFDVHWADPFEVRHWLAWDGTDILGPTIEQNQQVQARVAAADTSTPVPLKLTGQVFTRRNDEILSLQTLDTPNPNAKSRLLVASSKGAPAGTVVACGPDTFASTAGVPAGIVAGTDGAIYVSYAESNLIGGSNVVIARVTP
jgi:hypothetical protein